tara:strand:+ start:408 stop:980 length:573 start_codon:yes stop_codon:yes gene_type:complete
MSYLFNEWPTVSYDLKKNGKPLKLTNITLRFKINELLRDKSVVMYTYDVQDGERPDIIAYKYYNDPTLDWVILLTNNIIDPQFEWPLDDRSFERYIKGKYGSLEAAKQTNHVYEKTLNEQIVRFDGTIIPKRSVVVDKETYDLTSPTSRRAVDKYTYELELNEARSQIKLLDKRYLPNILSTYENIVEQA